VPPADFCKNTSNEKSSNSPLQLEKQKTKYSNRSVMVCCQFFLLKINRLFLLRDAKLKMNQKKNRSTSFFSGEREKLKIKLIFISILKNNSNYNNFKENYWEKILSFPNYVYLKR
jgi:hypothetical protein